MWCLFTQDQSILVDMVFPHRCNNGIANCETNHHCYETRLQEMAIFLLEFLDYSLFFSEILTSNKVALASSIKHFRVDVQKTATSITTSRSMSALA